MHFTGQLAIPFLLSIIDGALGYTCSYVDTSYRLHYVYCPHSECCGPSYHRYCCTYANVTGIVGGVVGFVIFVIIVASIVSCCCCACCPVYGYRMRGTSYVTTSTAPIITVQSGPPDYGTRGPVDVVITDANPPYYVQPETTDIIITEDSYSD